MHSRLLVLLLSSSQSRFRRRIASVSRRRSVWELKPSGSELELLEEIREGYPDHHTLVGDHFKMNDKVFGRLRSKHNIEKSSSEVKTLGRGLGELNVVAGRN